MSSPKLSSRIYPGIVNLAGKTSDSRKTAESLLEEDRQKHHCFFNPAGFHNHLSHQWGLVQPLTHFVDVSLLVFWPRMTLVLPGYFCKASTTQRQKVFARSIWVVWRSSKTSLSRTGQTTWGKKCASCWWISQLLFILSKNLDIILPILRFSNPWSRPAASEILLKIMSSALPRMEMVRVWRQDSSVARTYGYVYISFNIILRSSCSLHPTIQAGVSAY